MKLRYLQLAGTLGGVSGSNGRCIGMAESGGTAIAISLFSAAAAVSSAVFAGFAWNEANSTKATGIASAVFLGEASGTGHDLPPEAVSSVWTVVNNAGSTQINGVWVEGKNGTSILIQGIPACQMYALDADFEAVAVHYKDTEGNGWRRTLDGLSDSYGDPPAKGTDTHDSPWWEPIENCSA